MDNTASETETRQQKNKLGQLIKIEKIINKSF